MCGLPDTDKSDKSDQSDKFDKSDKSDTFYGPAGLFTSGLHLQISDQAVGRCVADATRARTPRKSLENTVSFSVIQTHPTSSALSVRTEVLLPGWIPNVSV